MTKTKGGFGLKREEPPLFDNGYPYLLIRLRPQLHHVTVLPRELSQMELSAVAAEQATITQLPVCLVLAERKCVHAHPDGTVVPSDCPPTSGVAIGGIVHLSRERPESEETRYRKKKLAHLLAGTKPKPGSLPKGGWHATIEEMKELAGSVAGIPRGLVRCQRCGDYRGECLDPNPRLSWIVVRVHCRCQNDSRCARCGQLRYERRIGANYYCPDTNTVWHVSGLCGLGHQCLPR